MTEQLQWLPEFHFGEVQKKEDDLTLVSLANPEGEAYERYFETELLQEAGISVGDRVEMKFTTDVQENTINVHLRITGLGPAQSLEEIQAEIDETMKGLDLDRIREVFGSHLQVSE